jgi:hypothetical protein
MKKLINKFTGVSKLEKRIIDLELSVDRLANDLKDLSRIVMELEDNQITELDIQSEIEDYGMVSEHDFSDLEERVNELDSDLYYKLSRDNDDLKQTIYPVIKDYLDEIAKHQRETEKDGQEPKS